MESSETDCSEIPSEYLKLFNQIKNKKLHYDQDEYFYSSEDINSYLFQRFKSRTVYYKKKYNLNDQVTDLFIKILECMHYEKLVKYNYFIKKMCDYYNKPCDKRVKKHKT